MEWLVRSQKIYRDLVTSWLRSEIARLTHVLKTMEDTNDYHDEFIHKSIEATETGLRRIKKFIEFN